jgi:glyoxylase-like metal-dependent hydrolase (beta-lactamase superfamily II)
VFGYLVAITLWVAPTLGEVVPSPVIRVYAFDAGRLVFTDLGAFSDTGEYDRKPGTLAASCFLIRHPKGDLLWDSGVGDRYASEPEGVQLPRYRVVVPRTVASQLASIGLTYSDITYFAFSHGHGDHLGNADQLGNSRWIVNRNELAWLEAVPPPPRTDIKLLAARDPAKSIVIEGDHDVFGDGSVRILSAPGHTPGHQVLLVTFPKGTALLLSGDLFHTRENRALKRMPIFNVNRADTLASIDRIERIIANKRARVVIQHSEEDLAQLPVPPAFIDE